MSDQQLITQTRFVDSLTNGIAIPPRTSTDLLNFGDRLIKWVNANDNYYWAAWDDQHPGCIALDLNTISLMLINLSPGLLEFRRLQDNIEHDMAKEFGNGAVGIILFCMIENREIQEVPLDDIPPDPEPEAPTTIVENKETPDFSWI